MTITEELKATREQLKDAMTGKAKDNELHEQTKAQLSVANDKNAALEASLKEAAKKFAADIETAEAAKAKALAELAEAREIIKAQQAKMELAPLADVSAGQAPVPEGAPAAIAVKKSLTEQMQELPSLQEQVVFYKSHAKEIEAEQKAAK